MITTATYDDAYKNKIIYSKKFYLFFKIHDTDFIDLEVIPFIESYFNYLPPMRIYSAHKFKKMEAEGIRIEIQQKSIVSFYKDILGIVKSEKIEKFFLMVI